ncbi:MAG: hypothetical protein IKX40_13635 [Thermoguttaceae bacterium]|nr:hypothetical protein [Thermoguttaceae bacterium]
MNTNSKDVVKNVESNNVESTSNEQRQTNKPIVISRRRLLRAGVAGIPVVLTMVGIAPADSIQTVPSAASALWYGGNKVYNRFADNNTIVKDGLVWTDHNGFVLKSTGSVYTNQLSINTDTSSTNGTDGKTTFELTAYSYVGTADPPPSVSEYPSKTFTASITPPTDLTVNAYLHKTGVWYTDRIVTSSSKDLLEYIKGLTLTVNDGSNSVTATVDVQDAALSSDVVTWIKTPVQGYTLGNSTQGQNYYLLPEEGPSVIDSVIYKAKVSFTYTSGDYTYKCTNQPIEIPLKLNVTGIPNQVRPGDI